MHFVKFVELHFLKKKNMIQTKKVKQFFFIEFNNSINHFNNLKKR